MRAWWLIAAFAAACDAQVFTYRGFLDTRTFLYPQTAYNDNGRAVAETLLRWEPSLRPRAWLRLNASLDARWDTHRQAERSLRLDWQDRGLRRPAMSVRRLSAVMNRGPLTLELGKQFIRWGKTDILNPTDRFAPRDFLSVVTNDFLAVPAARATVEFPRDTFDLIWQPRFTPSRTPLFNQRWTVLPAEIRALPLRDAGASYPGGSQVGARWNHIWRGGEFSASLFEGRQHLPQFDVRFTPLPPSLEFERRFPRLRLYGADGALPLRWFTVKGEAAYFSAPGRDTDAFIQGVLQLERVAGEWQFGGGYAGERVTRRRSALQFAPERGLAKAFLGRASYTIDVNRSVLIEFAARRNGDGAWVRAEYSQAFGQHWRATAGFTWIGGHAPDFLGQYHRNSHFSIAWRYSF
jgi:hypothetical protein